MLRPERGRERWLMAVREVEGLKEFVISLRDAGFTFHRTFPVILPDEMPETEVVGTALWGDVQVVKQRRNSGERAE